MLACQDEYIISYATALPFVILRQLKRVLRILYCRPKIGVYPVSQAVTSIVAVVWELHITKLTCISVSHRP